MDWLAATNLQPDSQGVLALAAWIFHHRQDEANDAFVACCVARDADFFTASATTRRSIAERLAVALRQTLDASPAQGVFSRVDVRSAASVAKALSEQAQHARAVLLIGRQAPRHGRLMVRLGAVTRRVVRRLTTPVVVTPADWTAQDAGSGPVLVAIDPTEPSLSALTFGRRFAAAVGREVEVGHVLPGIEDVGVAYLASNPATELRREHTAAALGAFQAFVDSCNAGGLPTHVLTGATVDALLELAEQRKALAIVTGSRRLALGERVFSASVGTELAALAPIPVAIVPPDFSN